jgi:hypothetical protein
LAALIGEIIGARLISHAGTGKIREDWMRWLEAENVWEKGYHLRCFGFWKMMINLENSSYVLFQVME